MEQLREALLEKFGCKNPHCVFYSPFSRKEKFCEHCIMDDWDRELEGKALQDFGVE